MRGKLAMIGLILGSTAFIGCDQGGDQAPANNPDSKVMKYKVGDTIYTVQFALEGEEWVPVPSEAQRMVEKLYNDNPNAGISVDANDPQLRHLCLSTEECDRLAVSPGKGAGAATGDAAIESASHALSITSPYPTLFENKRFGGRSLLIDRDIPNLGDLRDQNGRWYSLDDKASSLLGGSACGIRIYRYPDFRDGRTYQVPAGGNVPDLSKKYVIWPSSWEDAASSVVPLCPPTYSCDIDMVSRTTNCALPYVDLYHPVSAGRTYGYVSTTDLIRRGAINSIRLSMRICNPSGWTFVLGHDMRTEGNGQGCHPNNCSQAQLHDGVFSVYNPAGELLATMNPTLDANNCWNESLTLRSGTMELAGNDSVSINTPELFNLDGFESVWFGFHEAPARVLPGSGLERVTITIGAY